MLFSPYKNKEVKKTIRHFSLMVLFSLLSMSLFVACGDKEEELSSQLTSITFAENEVKLYVGISQGGRESSDGTFEDVTKEYPIYINGTSIFYQ